MYDIRVAVVILNWNGEKFLHKFLPGVMSALPDYARVFVADNGSTDGSVAFLKQNYPQVALVLLDKNYGFAGGYNKALKNIDAEYFVLLNSDILVSGGWIEKIIDFMEKDKTVACCQPKILSYYQPQFFEYAGAAGGFIDYLGYPFCRGRIFDTQEKDNGQYDKPSEVFWASGACLFLRSKAFYDVSGFDDDFFAHMEEIDMCWRMKRVGWRVFSCPQSVVFHVGGGTLPKNNPYKTFLNFRNSHYMLAKNLNNSRFILFFITRLLLDILAAFQFLFKGQTKDFLAVWKALFAALSMMKENRRKFKTLPNVNVKGVFQRSIVKYYFLNGEKKFSDLKSEYFT
ncbi:MAG: glycosyltransferase [Bacteroidales bacterium]